MVSFEVCCVSMRRVVQVLLIFVIGMLFLPLWDGFDNSIRISSSSSSVSTDVPTACVQLLTSRRTGMKMSDSIDDKLSDTNTGQAAADRTHEGYFVPIAPPRMIIFALATATPPALDCVDDPSAPLPFPSLSPIVTPYSVLSVRCRYNGDVHLTANNEELEFEHLNITFVGVVFAGILTVDSLKLGNGSSMTFLSCQGTGTVFISPTLTTASSLFLFQNFSRRVEEDISGQFRIVIRSISLLNGSRFIMKDSTIIAGASTPISINLMNARSGSVIIFTNVKVLHGGYNAYALLVERLVEITDEGTRFVVENSTFESSYGVILRPKSAEGSEIVVLGSVFSLKNPSAVGEVITGFVAIDVKTLIFDQNSRILGGGFSMSQTSPGQVRNCRIILRESHLSRVEFLDKRAEIPLPADYNGDSQLTNNNNTLILMPSTNISVSLLVSSGIETSFGLVVGGDGDGMAAAPMVIPLIQLSARWCVRCSFLVSNVISTNTSSSAPTQDLNKFGLLVKESQFWYSKVALAGYVSNIGYITFKSDATFSFSNVTLLRIQTSQQVAFRGSFGTSSFVLSNATIADTITFDQPLVNAKVTIRDCLLIAPAANSVRFSNPIQNSSVSFLRNELQCKADFYSNYLILFPENVGGSLIIFRKNTFLSLGGELDLMRLSVDGGVLIFAADNIGSPGISLQLAVAPPKSGEALPTVDDEPIGANTRTQIHFHNFLEMMSVRFSVADAKNVSISFSNTSVLYDFTMTLSNIASSSINFFNFTSEAGSGVSISASSLTSSTFVMQKVRTLAQLLVDMGNLSKTNVTIADAHVRNVQLVVNAVEVSRIEVFSVVSGALSSYSMGAIEVKSLNAGLAFVNSTLAVSKCVSDTAGAIALAVRVSLGKGSQHVFTDNILTSNTTVADSSSALFYDRKVAVLSSGGDVIMLNNTLHASADVQTESSGAVVLRSNGSSILFDSSNCITSGIFRVELFGPADEATPAGSFFVEILKSALTALVVVVDFAAPPTANSVRFAIFDSDVGIGSSFGEAQPLGASFTLSVQDGSPVLGYNIMIRNASFGAGLFFDTAGVLCFNCRWEVQNVSAWTVMISSLSFSWSTLVFESMLIQRQFLFQSEAMLMRSQLLLRELYFIAEAVDSPLKIGPPAGAPRNKPLVFYTSSVLEISSCRAASILSGSVTSIIALFKRGSRANIVGNEFSSLWTGSPLAGVGALVFPFSGGSFETGSQLAVVNNTLAVSQEGYYILNLITAGGSFTYGKDNKCATVGRFAAHSLDGAPSSAFNISVHYHERLSYVDIYTLYASPSEDDPNAPQSTCISIFRSNLSGGMNIGVGTKLSGLSICIRESEVNAMSVSVLRQASSTVRVELSRLVVRRRMSVWQASSEGNTTVLAAFRRGGSFLISECELESLSIVTSSSNLTFILTNSTIKGAMSLSGSLVDSSLTIAHCQWPTRAIPNCLTVRSFSAVRTTILVSSSWMASSVAPLIMWSLTADNGTFVWFDNNEFHAQPSSSNPYSVYLDLSRAVQVTSQLNSLIRFTRNFFTAGNALPAEGTISLQLFLLCSRVEHDETNVYEGTGGLSVTHRAHAANNTVVFVGAKNSSFSYTAAGSSTHDFIRVEGCTLYNVLSVFLGTIATQTRISIINVTSEGMRINANVVSHSRILIKHFTTAKEPITLLDGTQIRDNVSLALRNSFINAPLKLDLDATCSTQQVAALGLRCLLIFENNRIVAPQQTLSAATGSALTVGGTLSDGVHLEILNNLLETYVISSEPTLYILDGALEGEVNVTINGNTMSTTGSLASFELRPSQSTGTIEIWGNNATKSMAFSVTSRTWNFLFIRNTASSFIPNLGDVDMGLPVGFRISGCNILSDGSNYEIPVGDIRKQACSKMVFVSRCPSLHGGIDFEQVVTMKTPVSSLVSCELGRLPSAGLLDFSETSVVPSFGLFLSCALCAGFSNAPYWVAFARVIWPTVIDGRLRGVPNICWEERHHLSPTVNVPYSRSLSPSAPPIKSATESVLRFTFSLSGTPTSNDTRTDSYSSRSTSSLLPLLSSSIPPSLTDTTAETKTITTAWTDQTESQPSTQSRSRRMPHSFTLSRPAASRSRHSSDSLEHLRPETGAIGMTASASLTGSRPSRSRSRSHTSTGAQRKEVTKSRIHETASFSMSLSAPATPTQVKRLLAPVPVGAVADALVSTVAAAGVVTSITAFVSVSGGQLGVANAMARLASCDGDSGGREGDVPALVHPLRFSVFRQKQKAVDGAYIAAALSNTVLIPAIVALLARFPALYAIKAMKGLSSEEEALACIGWPAVVMMPFVTLAEGIGVSIVRALLSGETVGIVFGLSGALSTAVFTAWWLRVLLVVIKRTSVTLVEVDPSDAISFPAMGFPMRCITPWSAWAPREADQTHQNLTESESLTRACAADTALGDISAPLLLPSSREEQEVEVEGGMEAEMTTLTVASRPINQTTRDRRHGGLVDEGGGDSRENVTKLHDGAYSKYVRAKEEQLERYGSTVGDKRLFYAEIVTFALSLLVGVCEGMPAAHCKPRAIIAAFAAILQCACNCLSFVPIGLFLEASMSVFVVPMSALVVVEVFSSSSSLSGNVSLLPVIEALSLAANIVGLAIVAVGLLLAVRELTTTTATARSKTKGNKSVEERANAVSGPSAGLGYTAAHVGDTDGRSWTSELIESPLLSCCPPATGASADQRQFQQDIGGDAISSVAPVLAVETEARNLSGGLFVADALPILSAVPEGGRLRQASSVGGSAFSFQSSEYFSSSRMGMGRWDDAEQSEEDRVRLLVLECFGEKRR